MKNVIIIWALALIVGVAGYGFIDHSLGGRVLADQAPGNSKYDGDCPTPPDFATAGRCADKCPDQNMVLQGYDKNTGAAICYYPIQNPCPYADAQPANGPVCEKLTAQAQAAVQQPAPVEGFTGK